MIHVIRLDEHDNFLVRVDTIMLNFDWSIMKIAERKTIFCTQTFIASLDVIPTICFEPIIVI